MEMDGVLPPLPSPNPSIDLSQQPSLLPATPSSCVKTTGNCSTSALPLAVSDAPVIKFWSSSCSLKPSGLGVSQQKH